MVKEEEYKEFKKDIKFYGISFAMTVIVMIIVLAIYSERSQDRLEVIESDLGIKEGATPAIPLSQPNPLEGWEEVCMESRTIIYNESTGIIKFCKDGCMDKGACLSAFGEYTCDYSEQCELQCQQLFNISKYKIWNETICVKKMLVKEG